MNAQYVYEIRYEEEIKKGIYVGNPSSLACMVEICTLIESSITNLEFHRDHLELDFVREKTTVIVYEGGNEENVLFADLEAFQSYLDSCRITFTLANDFSLYTYINNLPYKGYITSDMLVH